MPETNCEIDRTILIVDGIVLRLLQRQVHAPPSERLQHLTGGLWTRNLTN